MGATAKYDSTKPVTIHNPLPQDQWPIRKGRKVVFLSSKWYSPIGIDEDTGTIRWYNPALETTYTTSKGHPNFTISVGKSANIVPACNVFPDTKAGRINLQKRKAEFLLACAKSKREEAKRCIDDAKKAEAQAETIHDSLK